MNNLLKQYQIGASAPLDSAQSLPFAVYHDDAVYQQERQHIFASEWVFICCDQELPNAGDYFAVDLAGEAIAVVRSEDGQLRALSNICRHRGTPLLEEGFGNVSKHIVCPYHAWAYSDDGTLKAAPMRDKSFDNKTHCLPTFHLQQWQGLVFVNLADDPAPLSERFAGLDDYLSMFDLASFNKAFTGEFETWNANWKLAMENAMESYHLFQVHKPTLEEITPTRDAFYVAGSSDWTVTAGKMVDTSSRLTKWLSGSYPEAYDHYLLVALAPSFVGILTCESFDWIQVLPISATKSLIRSGGISSSIKSYKNRYVKEFTNAFFEEDRIICERVQKGMQSQKTTGGQLFEVERIVVDFHQFLASRLFNTACSDFHQHEKAEIFLNPESE